LTTRFLPLTANDVMQVMTLSSLAEVVASYTRKIIKNVIYYFEEDRIQNGILKPKPIVRNLKFTQMKTNFSERCNFRLAFKQKRFYDWS